VQQALRDVSQDAAEYSFKVGAQLDEDLLKKVAQTTAINKINTPAFRAKAKPLYDEIAKQAGTDMMQMALDSLKN
jgi:TRAP-type C4-dicarboxylate transport system substrate-binding protein